jgi:hypothetical protein
MFRRVFLYLSFSCFMKVLGVIIGLPSSSPSSSLVAEGFLLMKVTFDDFLVYG